MKDVPTATEALRRSRGWQGMVAAVTLVATVITIVFGQGQGSPPWLERTYMGASVAQLYVAGCVGFMAILFMLRSWQLNVLQLWRYLSSWIGRAR